jgi:S1-C subfamily serine protease
MRRRAFLACLPALVLAPIAAFLFGPQPSSGSPAEAVCPQCEAPLEPGSAFCGRCGRKLERAVAPERAAALDTRSAVVQVVTAHDKELTSTFGSMVYEANLRVDSILGSAFAVAPGEFVTDGGLLVGAREVSLKSGSGRSVPARIIGSDAMIGIALLAADLPEVPPLSLREAAPPRTGESVTALGYPSDTRASREPVVSAGVISGLNRGPAGMHPVEDYLQTDASLPPGLAGGPMVDSQGRVVGMSTGRVFGAATFLGPQSGIGFAVPAAWVARALAWIRSGMPPRAWIGAYVVAADPESRARHNLPPHIRLLVEQVFPGSPASGAGLKPGDGLLKVASEEVSTLPRLHERLLGAPPGEKVEVEVSRAGQSRAFEVTLTPRPDKPRLAGIDALRFFAGLQLAPREDDRLVVATVAPGSYLARLKIAPGDVLQSVLSKKDWVQGAKDNSRWRSVRTVADLEARLETAYSDLDFCLGLRFRSKDGTKHELLLWEILTPTAAI